MIQKKVSPRVSVMILAALVTLISVFEWRALSAEDHPAPRIIDMQYCTSCHTDAATLRKMQWKEGSAHFLFHGPPPKYPASASASPSKIPTPRK